MKIRLKEDVSVDTNKIVNKKGKTLKVDEVEMEIVKMFKDGTPVYPIQHYIIKNYKIDKTWQEFISAMFFFILIRR